MMEVNALNVDQYKGALVKLVQKAISGNPDDIDWIMDKLHPDTSLVMSRYGSELLFAAFFDLFIQLGFNPFNFKGMIGQIIPITSE